MGPGSCDDRLRGIICWSIYPGNHILMLIVRKLDRELVWSGRISKFQSRRIARRRSLVTARTNNRPIAPEELWTMTANARIVVRKVSNVGKVADLLPVGSWYLVTRVARSEVLPGGMGELRVIDPRLPGGHRSRPRARTPPLRCGAITARKLFRMGNEYERQQPDHERCDCESFHTITCFELMHPYSTLCEPPCSSLSLWWIRG